MIARGLDGRRHHVHQGVAPGCPAGVRVSPLDRDAAPEAKPREPLVGVQAPEGGRGDLPEDAPDRGRQIAVDVGKGALGEAPST